MYIQSRNLKHLNSTSIVVFRLFLEEERDSIQTKCLRNQTTIAELRARLHHQKSGMIKSAVPRFSYYFLTADLERKLSAIACVESLSLGEPTSLSEVY